MKSYGEILVNMLPIICKHYERIVKKITFIFIEISALTVMSIARILIPFAAFDVVRVKTHIGWMVNTNNQCL